MIDLSVADENARFILHNIKQCECDKSNMENNLKCLLLIHLGSDANSSKEIANSMKPAFD